MAVDDPLLHLSRAAGIGAYLALWFDMCLGVALTGWLKPPFLARWRIGDLHQFTGLLGLGLLATHIGLLIGLQNMPFTPAEILVPFLRQVHPIAPVFGVSALYVLLLVTLISHARRFVGLRVWRSIHLLSFVGFGLTLAHAVAAGPDASNALVIGLYVVSVSILGALTLRRVRLGPGRPRRRVSQLPR